MKTGFFVLLVHLSPVLTAQVSDHFSDGNFSANPSWTGTTADFVVNSSGQLQTNNTVPATSWLSTPHGLSSLEDVEWRYWIKQSFSSSSSNYGRIYLTAATADLDTHPDGFFLQLGEAGSTDALRLFRTVGGVDVEICSGTPGQLANAFTIGIRVVRSNTGLWSLYADITGGTNYTLISSAADVTSLTGTHCGVLAVYTASNANKFFFDDIYVGPEIIDGDPPAINSIVAPNALALDVYFSEAVAGSAIGNPANYALNPMIPVQSAVADGTDPSLIHLTLASSLANGQYYNLTVAAIEDIAGNTAVNVVDTFRYLVSDAPAKGDLIITEFLCDPTPAIGLAELEYVEIFNNSNKYFELTGWKLGDAASDGTITGGWIMPGEYRILCASSSLSYYSNGIAVSAFPSLNNAGDDIVLKDNNQLMIDVVRYTDAWYNDAMKQEGGYALERINPDDPCSDVSNWTASEAASGGTPGLQNSVFDASPDIQPPVVRGTLAIAPNQLQLFFSEGMDSTLLATAVMTFPGLVVDSRMVTGAHPSEMFVAFVVPLVANQLYDYTLEDVADCWLNSTTVNGNFALADQAAPGDIVINELLFDPVTGGSDFVELYNHSAKVLDLYGYALANYDADTIANRKTIPDHYLLFPGDYLVLTADSAFQHGLFPAAVPGRFYPMILPGMDNDSSTVYLFGGDNQLLDKVSYSDDWHLSLIDDTENKTLERIDPNGHSSNGGNWHTAAESIGFGTPGGQNSQFQSGEIMGAFGTMQPVFSPDNDGHEDVLQFYYTMEQSGMIAGLTIFDNQGRPVKKIAKNELLGLQGKFTWDGSTDQQLKSPIGVYIGVIEAFSSEGELFSKRVAFTLAGKLD